MDDEQLRPVLAGKKALIFGIANENSIAPARKPGGASFHARFASIGATVAPPTLTADSLAARCSDTAPMIGRGPLRPAGASPTLR